MHFSAQNEEYRGPEIQWFAPVYFINTVISRSTVFLTRDVTIKCHGLDFPWSGLFPCQGKSGISILPWNVACRSPCTSVFSANWLEYGDAHYSHTFSFMAVVIYAASSSFINIALLQTSGELDVLVISWYLKKQRLSMDSEWRKGRTRWLCCLIKTIISHGTWKIQYPLFNGYLALLWTIRFPSLPWIYRLHPPFYIHYNLFSFHMLSNQTHRHISWSSWQAILSHLLLQHNNLSHFVCNFISKFDTQLTC